MKLLVLWFCLAISGTAFATWRPEFSQMDPKLREWYRQQIAPGSKIPCCSESDGVNALEDIRDGHHWAKFETRNGIVIDWQEVPAEAVLQGSNLNGTPVVWYGVTSKDNQVVYMIRCFAPGAKT